MAECEALRIRSGIRWRKAMPAILAIPATGRRNTGSAPLRRRCDFCDFAPHAPGRDMAAIPATSRRNTSESQESQQGPRVILTRLPSYRAPRKKSQKSLTSRNRWNPHKH